MVYYEFYGLPGCGKTTLSRKVVYQLQEKGYKVADFSCIFLNENFGKPKLIEYVRLIFQIREYSLFYHYWKLFRECHCNSKRRLTNLMILTNKIFRESRKNRYDMVLLEEGIIQFISSFNYLGAIRKSNRFDKIVKQLEKNVEICPIYCRLDVDTSLG